MLDTIIRIIYSTDFRYFVEIKRSLANIYLKYKNDRKSYAQCYGEIVEFTQSLESFLALGDAYMSIQEPEQAVSVYKSALNSYPNESSLKSKIGKALVKTHDYKKAITYYEDALARSEDSAVDLKYDLADLYCKLKLYDNSERLILAALDHEDCNFTITHMIADDVKSLSKDIQLHRLLAKLHKNAKQYDKSLDALSKARSTQLQQVFLY